MLGSLNIASSSGVGGDTSSGGSGNRSTVFGSASAGSGASNGVPTWAIIAAGAVALFIFLRRK